MIPRIKKILYATDLTKNSAYAFRYAINSSQKHDAQIIILHVIEKLSPGVEGLVGLFLERPDLEKIWQEKKVQQIQRLQRRLEEFSKRELQDDPDTLKRVTEILVTEGEPASVILEKATTLNCDVVVMGSHGHGLGIHSFLGSVAQKVLDRIRKPVYVIPIPEENTDITFRDI